jgi:hypothetical protein
VNKPPKQRAENAPDLIGESLALLREVVGLAPAARAALAADAPLVHDVTTAYTVARVHGRLQALAAELRCYCSPGVGAGRATERARRR